MNKTLISIIMTLFFLFTQSLHAGPDQAAMAVWVNEAIVATYSYNYKTYLQDQKKIAKYFTADAWIAYTKALNDSKLPESVQSNMYFVSAVPTEPPVITPIDATHWKAIMNVLVVFQNPQYKQHQNLKVTLEFGIAPSDQGVRGYTITSLQTLPTKPPCQCMPEEAKA
jgi:hypothetical protein